MWQAEHFELPAQPGLSQRERILHRCNRNYFAGRCQVQAFNAHDGNAFQFQYLGDHKDPLLARLIVVEACIFQNGINVKIGQPRPQPLSYARPVSPFIDAAR